MIVTGALFALGIALIVTGSYLLVDGASSIAHRLGVRTLTIGLTVVSIGTASPEIVVNAIAAVRGATEVTFGNVLGSNIFNLLAVLGLTAVVRSLAVGSTTVRYEIPMCVAGAVALIVIAVNGAIGTAAGIFLLVCFAAFLGYTIISGRRTPEIVEEPKHLGLNPALAIAAIIGGLAMLLYGGNLVVDSAVELAELLGVPQRVIALTVVAIGTSLPEIATSLMALFRRQVDLAIGNAVGSCIVNVTLILGLSSIITPVQVPAGATLDLAVYLIASIVLLFFAITPVGSGRLQRLEGVTLLVGYAGYLVALVLM